MLFRPGAYFKEGILILLVLGISVSAFFSVVIPPISGEVVDAITGAPISGIAVTLRAETRTTTGLSFVDHTLRYENKTTDQDGRFDFPWSVHLATTGIFTRFYGYALSVNKAFIPSKTIDDPEYIANLASDIELSPTLESPGNGPVVSNHAYFPIWILFQPCHQNWNGNCVSFNKTDNLTVALIPVLDDPSNCKDIQVPSVAESCRQLNTYRSAYLNLKTVADINNDLKICNQVDGGGAGSRDCVTGLIDHIRVQGQEPGPLQATNAVLLQSVKTLAGGTSTSEFVITSDYNPAWMGDANGLYVQYVADYDKTSTEPSIRSYPFASVEVDQFTKPDDAQNYFSSILQVFPLRKEDNRDVKMGTAVVSGSKIETYDGPSYSGAIWKSGTSLVDISFYKIKQDYYVGAPSSTVPQPANQNERNGFISSYLVKYPSSL